MLLSSCGGPQTKELAFDKTLDGDKSGIDAFGEMIEFADSTTTLTMEKLSKSDTGRAFDEQNWTIEIPFVVKDDTYKSESEASVTNKLLNMPLTATVCNQAGDKVSGLTDFMMADADIKALAATLMAGKDTKGKLVFTHSTNNSDNCDKWFDKEAASVKVTVKVKDTSKLGPKSGGDSKKGSDVKKRESAPSGGNYTPGEPDDPRHVAPENRGYGESTVDDEVNDFTPME